MSSASKRAPVSLELKSEPVLKKDKKKKCVFEKLEGPYVVRFDGSAAFEKVKGP